MRADLEMVCGEGNEIVVVRVYHDVSTEISQFYEVLLPRFRPAVRPRVRNNDRVNIEKGLGEADVEVGMEFAPVLGEVDRSPAARDLREVRSRVLGHVVCCEHGPGVEERPSFLSCLDDFWLVRADSEHLRGQVLVLTVPIPVVNDRQKPSDDEYDTYIGVGSSSTSHRKEAILPRRLQG